FVVYYLPGGLMSFVTQTFQKKAPADIAEAVDMQKQAIVAPAPPTSDHTLLSLSGITMSFGGLKALNDVSLEVERGRIHGLIGPNGSGKSTLINVLSGIYDPSGGKILFQGKNLVGLSAPRIAHLGCARTFQNIQLFDDLSVLENVLVGLHATYHA